MDECPTPNTSNATAGTAFERTVNLRFSPPSCTERFKIDSRTTYPKGLTQLGEADIRQPRAAHNAICYLSLPLEQSCPQRKGNNFPNSAVDAF